MASIECHIIKLVARRDGIQGTGVSVTDIEKKVPKNTNGSVISDALDELCDEETFIDRNGSDVVLVGPSSDVKRYLRDNCAGLLDTVMPFLP